MTEQQQEVSEAHEDVASEEICGGGCELPEGSCPACLGAI